MNSFTTPPGSDTFPILSAQALRQLEEKAASQGISYAEMMERAGKALADRIQSHLPLQSSHSVLFLIGPGNNGGDGLVAARELASHTHHRVSACFLCQRDDPLARQAADAGVESLCAVQKDALERLAQWTANADVIVDALFGIGLRLPLPEDAVQMLRTVRNALSDRLSQPPSYVELTQPIPTQPAPYLIAVDCPSGFDVDTGAHDPHILRADETMTFLSPKPGFFRENSAPFVGRITVATLGVTGRFAEADLAAHRLITANSLRKRLPVRSNFSDKRSNGSVLIIAGCQQYIGAIALAARAAQRCGAGLIHIACPSAAREVLAGQLLEAVWLPIPDQGAFSPRSIPIIQDRLSRVDAVVLGPGMGLAAETLDFLSALLDTRLPPLVIDADGLNLCAQRPNWFKRLPPSAVITPHQREFARLSGLSLAEIQSNRWELATRYSTVWDVTLLLKGAYTVIASPNRPNAVLPFQLAALATAGTGDALSGIISAFLAQGCEAEEAAIAGGILHALAGIQAEERVGSARSVIASDVIDALGAAFSQLESGSV